MLRWRFILILLLCFSNFLHAQQCRWAIKGTSTGNDNAATVKADNRGNIYVSGIFSNTISFDSAGTPKSTTSAGGKDIYLVKVNCANNRVWCVRVGGTSNDAGAFNYTTVDVSKNGEVFLTGTYTSTATFTSTNGVNITKTAVGGSDIFLAKYDTNGVIKWVVSSGSTADDEGTSIHIDDNGDVFASGLFRSSCTFNTITGSAITKSSSGGADLYVARYDKDGKLKWVAIGGGPGDDIANQVITDRVGNIYAMSNVTCCFGGTANFGSVSFNNSSSWGGVIAKLAQDGTWKWVNGMGTTAIEGCATGIIDDELNVYVFCHYSGASSFTSSPPGTAANFAVIGGFDVALVKMDSNGVLQFAKRYGGTGDDWAWDMKFYNGNILLTGKFSNTASFNGKTLVSSGSSDAFIVEVDKSGVGVNAMKLGGSGTDEGFWLDIDNAGAIYSVGYFNGTASFPPYSMTSAGGNETYIVKFAPTNSFLITGYPDLILCMNDSAILYPFDKQANVTYQWLRNGVVIPGATNDTLVTKIAGNYKLVYTSSCNESDTSQQVAITQFSGTPSTTFKDTSICAGDSVRLHGTGGSGYSWFPTTGLSNPTIPFPYAKPLVTTKYYVQISSSGCTFLDSVNVRVDSFLLKAHSDKEICLGDSVQLHADSGAVSYTWSPNYKISNQSIREPLVFPDHSTSYIVQMRKGSCFTTDTVDITLHNVIIDAGPDVSLCPGDSVRPLALGSGIVSWRPSTGVSDTMNLQPYIKPNITTKYYLTLFDGVCSAVDSFTLNIKAVTQVEAGSDLNVCRFDSVQFTASNSDTFEWSPINGLSDPFIPNPKCSPASTMYYYVKGTIDGCSTNDSLKVTVIDLPVVTISDLLACKNSIVTLNGNTTGGDIYKWSPATGLDNPDILTPSLIATNNTTYKLTVTNSVTGCSNSANMNLFIDSVHAEFTSDPDKGIAPFKASMTNHSKWANSYAWYFDSSNTAWSTDYEPSFMFTLQGIYRVMLIATSQIGCKDTAYHSYEIFDDFKIYIPNVFSPNGDNLNDQFIIHVLNQQLLRKLEGRIWNRWGELLYTFTIPGGSYWDGTFQGLPCQQDVYVYQILTESLTGKKTEYRVMLLY